jgi:replicative DNA helicase
MQPSTHVRPFTNRRPHSDGMDIPMPSDPELESIVLGGILSSGSTTDAKKHVFSLDEGCFHDPVLRRLFAAAHSLVMKGRTVSPSLMAIELGKDALEGFGGSAMLTDLASRGVDVGCSMPEAISTLRGLANRREGMASARELLARLADPEANPEEAMSFCSRRLIEGLANGGTGSMRSKLEVAQTAIDERLNATPAITTGIKALDGFILGGLRPRTFIVFESSFGRGKSALLATIADNLNAQGVMTLYITLESTAEELEMRMVARRMNLRMGWTYDQSHPGFAKMRDKRDDYLAKVPDKTMYLEMRKPDIRQLRQEILHAKNEYGVKVVIIDYIQCIGGQEKGTREDRFWFDVGRNLRDIAKEEDLAIIAAAQDDKVTSIPLRQTSTLLLSMTRDGNDDAMHFEIEKTNDSPYGGTDRSTSPPIILDPAGPHVRDSRAEDVTLRLQRGLANGEVPQE